LLFHHFYFLRQHQFLSTGSSSGVSASVTPESNGQLIKDFEKNQLYAQAAGLRSNTNGASASDLQKITDCHRDALEHGLNCVVAQDSWLAETNLQRIHAKLCPDLVQPGLMGRYRDNKVRASNTLFVRPTSIQDEMNNFIGAVQRFQTKWANSSTAIMDEQRWVNHVYEKISIVAIIMFGIVDIHPFRDGNGRTARIYMNIALKRILGLPFPVTVTAQVHQRREYVDAIKECRSRLLRISKGENVPGSGSVFENLTEVVVDRVLHAVVQVNSLVEAKAQSAAVEEVARLVRRAREKSATGQCVICLDDHPNVSTLCCGQAVHTICIVEWLSNQGTCITCRKPMPQLPPRIVQRQDVPPTNANDSAEETTEDTTDDTTSDDNDVQQDNNDTTEDTTEDTMDDTTSDNNDVQQDNNDTTEDTTEDTTDDTESADDTPVAQSIFCSHCRRNKSAVDCSNSYCGRCCQLYGQYGCTRHNV
jgi:fido (protein-threonine AMPylation protein)